jgi:hypothetical protein
MSHKFKVTDIIDACSIRVAPQWKYSNGGVEFVDDKLKIIGLNVDPSNTYIKQRLTSFLLGREVDLINPVLLSADPNTIRIACNVLMDNTDITYYFPELSDLAIAK